jgi:hypothetical protein
MLRQLLDKYFNFIPHPPVMYQRFCFAGRLSGQFRGIIKASVNQFRLPREHRACFMGMSANSDDIIETAIAQIVKVFADMV